MTEGAPDGRGQATPPRRHRPGRLRGPPPRARAGGAPDDWRGFAAGARQAGHALGHLNPPAGHVLLVVADDRRSTSAVLPVAGLDAAVAKLDAALAAIAPGTRHGPEDWLLGHAAVASLERFGRDARAGPPGGAIRGDLGALMLERVALRDELRREIGAGLLPVLVCLVTKDHDDVVVTNIQFARAPLAPAGTA